MTRRALSFGSVASAYERFRPGYPERLADEVIAYAGRPVRNALEIGAGTGKATRLFAGRGIAVTATEPDAAMLAELHRHVPGSVTTVQAAFEDLPSSRAFDLVYAAAAMHWTDPGTRWSRVAGLLAPGGVFASFGGPSRLTDPQLEAAVRDARAPWLDDDDVPSPDGSSESNQLQWPGTELVLSGLFTDVGQVRIERRETLSADAYLGLLSTVSAYLELTGSDRRSVLDRIRAVLPPSFLVTSDVDVHLARLA